MAADAQPPYVAKSLAAMLLTVQDGYVLEWGLLKLNSLISPQAEFLILQKYLLDYFNHIHIWQVSLQPSCGDTCQI